MILRVSGPVPRTALVAAWLAAASALQLPSLRAQEADVEPPAAAQAPQESRRLTDPQEAELDAQAAVVAGELRCPVCRNQSVLESNAELSREMQAIIRERLAAGESPDQVKAYFVSRYGEWILLKPTTRGLNLLVYLLPGVALVLGIVLLRGRLLKWARAGRRPESWPAPAEAESALTVEDERWLQDALREG